MKRKYSFILIVVCVLCVLSFTACNPDNNANDDYIADNEHCVVSLPQDYYTSFDNDENDEVFDVNLINAQTVNGKPKKEGFTYYKVLKNAPFRILTPLNTIQNRNANGQTLVYWKLNDTLYKDGDNYYSANTFTCNRDTEITPVYYDFRPVGVLMYEVDENHMPTVPNGEFFDNSGNIKEQAGVHYLYGVYDFEPNREFWCTDLVLNKFATGCTVKMVAENYSKRIYTLKIEIESDNIFENGEIVVETLYKIEGHGYMTNDNVRHIVSFKNTGLFVSLGEHTLEIYFV